MLSLLREIIKSGEISISPTKLTAKGGFGIFVVLVVFLVSVAVMGLR
jgi:hypothetical protein